MLARLAKMAQWSPWPCIPTRPPPTHTPNPNPKPLTPTTQSPPTNPQPPDPHSPTPSHHPTTPSGGAWAKFWSMVSEVAPCKKKRRKVTIKKTRWQRTKNSGRTRRACWKGGAYIKKHKRNVSLWQQKTDEKPKNITVLEAPYINLARLQFKR